MMTGSGRSTQEAIRKAMETYRGQVLHQRYLDPETGLYKYPYQITEKEVLSLAGVKSRSTLKASYHDGIKADLKALIDDLKTKAGKRMSAESADQSAPSGNFTSAAAGKRARIDQLTETIGALGYKIIALQKELEEYKRGTASQSKIVSLSGKQERRPHGGR